MAMAVVSAENSSIRRRTGNGAKLAPLENGSALARKIFSKKDLVESVRKMAPARYGGHSSSQLGNTTTASIPTAEGGSQLKVMEQGVKANASRFNEIKLLADRKTKELKEHLDTLQCLKMENQALTDMKQKATPEAMRIEDLNAKIEDSRLLTEEKLHYRRQLQHMHRRLAANQLTFDAHINAMEDALQSAIKEHDDVKGLMRQLEAGKTKALLDLHDIQRQVSTERRDRAKIIAIRKMEAHNAQKMEEWRKERESMSKDAAALQKGDLSAEDERNLQTKLSEREKLAELLRSANSAKLHEFSVLEQQFTTIRQATGVNDLEEMVEKFIGQEGNRQTLLKEQREVEVTLAGARKKKDEAEAKFSELKASGIGSTELNREVGDELSAEIQNIRMELKMTRASCERLEGVLVSLRQGAIGLFQRLENYRYLLDGEEEAVQGTNESSATIDPVEALGQSELILAKMLESVGGGGDSSPGRAAAVGDSERSAEEDSTAQQASDDVSATWAGLGDMDVPSARLNVRVKTLKEIENDDFVDHVAGAAAGKSEVPSAKEGNSTTADDDGQIQTADIVPTRDFLKLSSSRQHAEVMRKKEQEVKRKKMQDRYDAADEKEKEKLGSLADKKKRQREAINHLCQKKEVMGVPPGVTPKQDAMTRSQVFLSHEPELL